MKRIKPTHPLSNESLWYKDAIIYEVHVRAFHDKSADGMGDFRGLAEKLDYLHDLGVTAIWLLPFFPSPWKDDGYDISDYNDVHPAYGTLRDFEIFLTEAHRRGMRVITEMVLNHTSDQHPWFQRARRAPAGSKWRDFYVWSDTPEKYSETRIIFKDFESSNWTWDSVAKAYYWHRFYSHQPDLNFDSPHVRRSMLAAVDFWFDLGVDGLRLDAVPYLYEREGTNCENLAETHGFLRDLRRHVDSKYGNRMLLAEANQWPDDAIAYFGDGDECHMAFHFPLMPRLFMAHRMEDRFPIIDILEQTPPIPPNCQWALFLRNHDELTLEMVTDEERDYMYRVYAHDAQMRINLGIRRRLAPLLGNDRRRIELMNVLLFSMPGSPVIYYGDEIGMGDNIYLGDRNGVRTPMQWSADRNAGFSRANPQRLFLPVIIDPEYHYEALNVESQQNNPNSLLWWMKHLIALRKQSKALSRGSIEFLHPDNHRVLVFLRKHDDEQVLTVANISRFPQFIEIDLSAYKGLTPHEMLGRTVFPPIGDDPYVITLAPYGYYWFTLEPTRPGGEAATLRASGVEIPEMTISSWESVLDGSGRASLSRLLSMLLRSRRWFMGKHRTMRSVEMIEALRLPNTSSHILLIQVHYSEGDPEIYFVPVSVARGEEAQQLLAEMSESAIVRLRTPDEDVGVLYGAIWDRVFCNEVLRLIARRRKIKGETGELTAAPTRAFRRILGDTEIDLDAVVQKSEQSNTSILFSDKFLLKLFRRTEGGTNPELEIGRFITETGAFPHTPVVAGYLEYRPQRGEPMTLGVLHEYVPNQGDAWQYTMDWLGRYFEAALAQSAEESEPPRISKQPLELVEEELPSIANELIGTYIEDARLLGQRTAELHLSLCRDTHDPAFAPEPFSELYRKSLYHGMLGLTNRTLETLRQKMKLVPEDARAEARQVLELATAIRGRFRAIRDRKIAVARIRHHGDFHLGQVLYTGRDFLLTDFEGDRSRRISERRIKRSPLRDVACMMRSFHYASQSALHGQVPGVILRPMSEELLRGWARLWYSCVSAVFLQGYLRSADGAPFIPKNRDDLEILLNAYLMEKAVFEISYELTHRPDWIRIPLQGIIDMLHPAD
ncbi:MAG: maltose alpha-D-glucosyltransferase [Bryobacteraceae bacterium]